MAPPPPLPPPSAAAANSRAAVADSRAAANSSSSFPPIPLSSSSMLNYLWIPLLIALPKWLCCGSSSVNAQSTPEILRPSDSGGDFGRIPPRCPAPDPDLNFRPVIGILSHPGDGASGRLDNASDASFIAASYVKFVESAGARVIPLIYNDPPQVLKQKLELVNGVIFTGGWAKSGRYFEVVEWMFKEVLRKNDAGERFPLLAICLGFELVTMIVGEDKNILEKFNAQDQASTLQFMKNANNGTVFQRFPQNLLKKMSAECLVMQNHRYGISPEKFQKNKSLSRFFKILTTSPDKDSKVYVSTIQAQKYPVTAVQWHPEKNAFEWGSSNIPHSEDAIRVTQYVANFVVRKARMSKNRPPARKVLDNLIYNYSPTYCGKAGTGYDEVYIFSKSSSVLPKL